MTDGATMDAAGLCTMGGRSHSDASGALPRTPGYLQTKNVQVRQQGAELGGKGGQGGLPDGGGASGEVHAGTGPNRGEGDFFGRAAGAIIACRGQRQAAARFPADDGGLTGAGAIGGDLGDGASLAGGYLDPGQPAAFARGPRAAGSGPPVGQPFGEPAGRGVWWPGDGSAVSHRVFSGVAAAPWTAAA